MGKGKGIKHRPHSAELKLGTVERMRAGECVAALARELEVRRKLIYDWKAAVESGRGFPGSAHKQADAVVGATEAYAARESAERIKELEALVGRLTAENRFFKGALQSIEELRRLRGASSSGASSPKSKR